MTDCQDDSIEWFLRFHAATTGLRGDSLEQSRLLQAATEIKQMRARIEQLEAEAEAAAAQTARLCRDLADLARAAKDQSEIAYEAGYERGYEDAIATRQVALDDERQRGWDAGFAYGESREPRR